MRIISYNVNGLRSAIGKGLKEWMIGLDADAYCIQEIKLDDSIHQLILDTFPEFECYLFSAQKKGYSGVAVLTKKKPIKVIKGCGRAEFDNEGRVILCDYGAFTLLNAYYPSGSSFERQEVKNRFLDFMTGYLPKILAQYPNLVHLGDFNICHTELDIHNPGRHVGVSGFLPHEREWFTKTLNMGFNDAFRIFEPRGDHYTWWSYNKGVREKNLGWRIDYHMVSNSLKSAVKSSTIYSKVLFSDHCPIEIVLED